MAIEDLIRTLEEEAAERVEGLLAEARERAAAIRAEAGRRAERRREEFLAGLEGELRRGLASEAAAARREARARVLEARAAALDRVFERAREQLPEAAEDEAWAAGLPARLRRALSYLGDRAAVVECPPSLRDAVRAALPAGASATVESDPDAEPGAVVRSRDGAVRVDDTLAARLDRMEPELAIRLARRLEGGEQRP